jgi:hypothetical protein
MRDASERKRALTHLYVAWLQELVQELREIIGFPERRYAWFQEPESAAITLPRLNGFEQRLHIAHQVGLSEPMGRLSIRPSGQRWPEGRQLQIEESDIPRLLSPCPALFMICYIVHLT